MNKFVIYIVLVLLYLGVAKSLSPSEYGISYIQNEKSFSEFITGSPVSVILIDVHSTGFIMKTYYHKYKIVYGFQSYDEMIVRTSNLFHEKYSKYLGLEIFRRYEDKKEEFSLQPPGSVFIGDRHFGHWQVTKEGPRVWEFYRVYRNIPEQLGWNKWKPSFEFYTSMQTHLAQKKPFYGLNNEFGVKGHLTQENFPAYFEKAKTQPVEIKQFFLDYFKENFYTTRNNHE